MQLAAFHESLLVRMDPLLHFPPDELAAVFNSACSNEQEGERLAKELRHNQLGISKYLPCTASTPPVEAMENCITCVFVRRLCLLFQRRFRLVPILKVADIRDAEATAKDMLSTLLVRAAFERCPVVKCAERAILGSRVVDGILVNPIKEKLLRRVLALLICFMIYYRHSQGRRRRRAIQPMKG